MARINVFPCIFRASRVFSPSETGSLLTAPSSGESGANLIFGANVIDGRRGWLSEGRRKAVGHAPQRFSFVRITQRRVDFDNALLNTTDACQHFRQLGKKERIEEVIPNLARALQTG